MYRKTSNKPVRAGVIPYTLALNGVYFLMGVDKATGDLTDFGGGIKNGETIIEAAWREFCEESCNIFGDSISIDKIEKGHSITNYKSNAYIFFVPVPVKWLYLAEETFDKVRYKTEIKQVKWITEYEYRHMVFSQHSPLWKRVQNILRNSSWYELKKQITL